MFVGAENCFVSYILCMWVRYTYVAHMFEAAIMMGAVGQLALIPLVTDWAASKVLARIKGSVKGGYILFLWCVSICLAV